MGDVHLNNRSSKNNIQLLLDANGEQSNKLEPIVENFLSEQVENEGNSELMGEMSSDNFILNKRRGNIEK